MSTETETLLERLRRIEAGLTGVQERIDGIDAQLADLQSQGVFLDPDGQPVVPGWSERTENGRHVAWILVWPTAYSEATGAKRRQYVNKRDLDGMRATTERTQSYEALIQERDTLSTILRNIDYDLLHIIRRRNW